MSAPAPAPAPPDDDFVDTCDGERVLRRAAARALADRLFYLGFLALPWLWVLNAWTFAPHARDARGPGRDAALADWLCARDTELVVLAGFMELLTPALVDVLPTINVHPSLLPAFPGLRAWEQALEAGATETGVTVHLVDHGLDTGPVLAQETVPVVAGDDAATLHARIQEVEHRLLPDVVGRLARNEVPTPQEVAG